MIKQGLAMEVTEAVLPWVQLQKDKKEKGAKTGRVETFWGRSSKLLTGDNLSNSQASAHHEVSRGLLEINQNHLYDMILL